MAKYFIDFEFLEGTQKEKFPISLFRKNTPPTIDMISVGIVSEDNREYYVISKDFNLKEAWNRFDEPKLGQDKSKYPDGTILKNYWIRENVLLPIYKECISGDMRNYIPFSYNGMKEVLRRYGKTNEQIAKEIKAFVYDLPILERQTVGFIPGKTWNSLMPIEFYGYYADYDWVVFCWLFGKMMDLPKGFPMYCKDLKQIFDEKQYSWFLLSEEERTKRCREMNLYSTHVDLKQLSNYPKQENEHNALSDAIFTKNLYHFLHNL